MNRASIRRKFKNVQVGKVLSFDSSDWSRHGSSEMSVRNGRVMDQLPKQRYCSKQNKGGRIVYFLLGTTTLCYLISAPYLATLAVTIEIESFIMSYVLDSISLVCCIAQLWWALQEISYSDRESRNDMAEDSEQFTGWRRLRILRRLHLARWPLIELVIAVPYDALLWNSSAQEYIPYVRLTRLLQFFRIPTYFNWLSRSLVFTYTKVKIIQICVYVALATNLIACIFITVAERIAGNSHYKDAPWRVVPYEPSSNGELYLRALYWALMSLTTTGHVDIIYGETEENKGDVWEVLIAMVVMLLATLVYTTVIANVTSVLLRQDRQVEQYRMHLEQVEQYLSHRRVRPDLRRLVRKHFQDALSSDPKDDAALLQQMPRTLRVEVMRDMHYRLLKRCWLFLTCDAQLLKAMCSVMSRATFVDGQTVCATGEIVTDLLFLEKGTVLSKRTSSYVSLRPSANAAEQHARLTSTSGQSDGVQPGLPPNFDSEAVLTMPSTPLCETAFLFNVRQSATLSAVGAVECLLITRADFLPLSGQFQVDIARMRDNCLVRVDRDDPAEAAYLRSMVMQQDKAGISELLYFAGAGDVAACVRLMDGIGRTLRVNPNSGDYDQRTPMHVAASEGQFPVVKLLCERGADVNPVDRFGNLPLGDALRAGHAEVARFLFSVGAVLGWDEARTSAELCELARLGRVSRIDLLIECRADINAQDYDGRTCLHLASSEGSLRVVESLLDHKADINVRDRWRGTPLRDAAREGFAQVAKLIRERGGDLGFTTIEASSELCELARQGNVESLRLLLECGADVNAADYDRRTCLHLAASEGIHLMITLLIGAGAKVNWLDRWLHTPLHDACLNGHAACAKILLAGGGRLQLMGIPCSHMLCESVREGKLERLQLLLECDADVNAQDHTGVTAAHIAVATGNGPILSLLCFAGADLHIKDHWGNTPTSDADKSSNPELLQLVTEEVKKKNEIVSRLQKRRRRNSIPGASTVPSQDLEPDL